MLLICDGDLGFQRLKRDPSGGEVPDGPIVPFPAPSYLTKYYC